MTTNSPTTQVSKKGRLIMCFYDKRDTTLKKYCLDKLLNSDSTIEKHMIQYIDWTQFSKAIESSIDLTERDHLIIFFPLTGSDLDAFDPCSPKAVSSLERVWEFLSRNVIFYTEIEVYDATNRECITLTSFTKDISKPSVPPIAVSGEIIWMKEKQIDDETVEDEDEYHFESPEQGRHAVRQPEMPDFFMDDGDFLFDAPRTKEDIEDRLMKKTEKVLDIMERMFYKNYGESSLPSEMDIPHDLKEKAEGLVSSMLTSLQERYNVISKMMEDPKLYSHPFSFDNLDNIKNVPKKNNKKS